MVGQPEDVDRLAGSVHVPANPGEGSRAVLQGVRRDADGGLFERDDLASEIGVGEQVDFHGITILLGQSPGAAGACWPGIDRHCTVMGGGWSRD